MKKDREGAFVGSVVPGILCGASLLLSVVNEMPVPQTTEAAPVEKESSARPGRPVPTGESGKTTVEVSPDSDLGRFLNSNVERPKMMDPRAHGR